MSLLLIARYNTFWFESKQEKRFLASALFNFHSFLTVVLLGICTCTFVKMHFPAILEQRTGFRGFFWKAARIGERLSPWVAVGCFTMGVSIIFF
ncbi:unnamed protein product [Dovyalis caffra]|uniref:Protein kish n=1 Tax=Dovyalis caffra TaxID=77055 RepID=A0AAV1R372_9ROSI|nr:unnamed protein product [Dovyalis caffra]